MSTKYAVRLDSRLHSDFKVACDYLGIDGSAVVRRAIRQTISDFYVKRKAEREYAHNFIEETISLEMYDLLKSLLENKVPLDKLLRLRND